MVYKVFILFLGFVNSLKVSKIAFWFLLSHLVVYFYIFLSLLILYLLFLLILLLILSLLSCLLLLVILGSLLFLLFLILLFLLLLLQRLKSLSKFNYLLRNLLSSWPISNHNFKLFQIKSVIVLVMFKYTRHYIL